MYCILKILNNNALLAKVKEDDSERILLGKGIGFGRKEEMNLRKFREHRFIRRWFGRSEILL